MGIPTPRTAVARGLDVETRLQILEGRGGIPARLSDAGYGSTAERDIYYTVPTTLDERVALANRKPIWFNTDLGWEESFYVPTGSAGLTARGLVAGSASTWYPTGRGPHATLYSAGPQSRTSAQQFTNYLAFGATATNVPPSNRNCSDDFIRYDLVPGTSAFLRGRLAGYYRARGMLSVQSGSGTAVMSLRVNTGDNLYGIFIQQYPAPLLASYGNNYLPEGDAVLFSADAYVFHYLDAGTLAIGHGSTFLSLEYLRPPLVTF